MERTHRSLNSAKGEASVGPLYHGCVCDSAMAKMFKIRLWWDEVSVKDTTKGAGSG